MQAGHVLIKKLLDQNWLEVRTAENTFLSKDKILIEIYLLGEEAANLKKGLLLFNLTEKATYDISWLSK